CVHDVVQIQYLAVSLFLHCSGPHPDLHSFPTRRSSDLRQLPDLEYQAQDATPANRAVYRIDEYGTESQRAVASPRQSVRPAKIRSEEHTSELQSRENLVCRLLLEKKKQITRRPQSGTCS